VVGRGARAVAGAGGATAAQRRRLCAAPERLRVAPMLAVIIVLEGRRLVSSRNGFAGRDQLVEIAAKNSPANPVAAHDSCECESYFRTARNRWAVNVVRPNIERHAARVSIERGSPPCRYSPNGRALCSCGVSDGGDSQRPVPGSGTVATAARRCRISSVAEFCSGPTLTAALTYRAACWRARLALAKPAAVRACSAWWRSCW
jgi:hypothetical protein